jgi:transcriptional regulator with XRE-family HTH domain
MNINARTDFPASLTYGAVLGQVIAKRRQLDGMHQKALAEGIGLTQSAYSKLEAGQSTMSVVHLRQIARQLKCTPHGLIEEADQLALQLEQQGVTLSDEKATNTGELLIGLGILAAIIAAAR